MLARTGKSGARSDRKRDDLRYCNPRRDGVRRRRPAPGFIDIKTHSDFTLPINPRGRPVEQ